MTIELANRLPSPMFASRRPRWVAMVLAFVVATTGALLPRAAQAVDGCLVLLCFAAPSWRAIPQCVPAIQQVLRDRARGRPFPTCAMSGVGNSATHRWAGAPEYCPPQYTHVFAGELGPVYSCDYSGAVSVTIDGEPWVRTWWSLAGGTVAEYSATAKASLGTWDTQFDDDYARWLAWLPPPQPPCPTC